jgi:hypothetical protein
MRFITSPFTAGIPFKAAKVQIRGRRCHRHRYAIVKKARRGWPKQDFMLISGNFRVD